MGYEKPRKPGLNKNDEQDNDEISGWDRGNVFHLPDSFVCLYGLQCGI